MAEHFRKVWNSLIERLTRKRITMGDILCVIAAFICISFTVNHFYLYDLKLGGCVLVENPWLVKTDRQGNQYVVDKEKERILKIQDGKVKQMIHGAAPSGDTFYYAENIAVAENGDVYVQDTGWNTAGFSLDNESILRYDGKGKAREICYRIDYDTIYSDKHRLFGMDIKDRSLYFVAADESGFSLNEMGLDDNQVKCIASYKMEEAITMIQDFVIDTDSLNVFAIDKRGKLYQATQADGQLLTLYQHSEHSEHKAGSQGKTVLYRGAMGANGTVYVTDIASNRLLRFSPEQGYEPETVLEGEQMWNVSCQELWDGRIFLSYVADGKICTVNADGSYFTVMSQYPKSAEYTGTELLFDLAAVTGALTAIYICLRLAGVIFTIPFSSSQKIGVLVISTVIVVSVIIVYGLMGQFKNIYRDELLTKLSMTAQIVSNGMNGEQLDEVEMPQSYMNDSYRKLWNNISMVLDKNYNYSKDIYCNILRYDGTTGYALIYLDNSIGTFYPLTADETQQVKAVYETGAPIISDIQSETGSYIYVMTPVAGTDGQVSGVISVGTLRSVMDGKISSMTKNIVIVMIMIVLVIMFLFSEILSFFDLKDRYRAAVRDRNRPIPMHVVRLSVFITFMAFNMATSFLPVYIMRFAHEGIGIPTALANSLPITLNLVFIGLTSLVCPRTINRLGFAKLAAVSGAIALCGDLLLATCVNYAMILAGLVLNGIGVGLITNSIHIFIASISRDDESGEGFSIFNAASLSGINCGMLFGAALAERLGQSRVFFISAMAWALVTLVFLVVGRQFVMKKSRQDREGVKKQNMLGFMASPGILKFMLCVQIPYIVMNSFTYYYVPIYGSEHGLSENVTSLMIITCSLCSVYLSVAVTNYLSRKFHDNAMYLSSIITFVGLLVFAWHMSIGALVAALVLIGLANSFGSSMRISCFIGMKASELYGEENAMGTYDFVDNLGESTGSIIFAGIISIGFRSGILGLIGCVGGLNAIYAFTEKKTGKDGNVS